MRCGLEEKGEKPGVFVWANSLEAIAIAIAIAIGCRRERIFDEFYLVLLGITEGLI